MTESSLHVELKPTLLTESFLNAEIEKALLDRYIRPTLVLSRLGDLILHVSTTNVDLPYAAIGRLWLTQGDIQFQVGDYEHALDSFTHAGELFDMVKDLSSGAACLAWKGRIDLIKCWYVSAMLHTIQGLEIAMALEERTGMARLLTNLGAIYVERGEFMRGLGILLRASNEAQNNDDYRIQVDIHECICRIYTALNNTSLALKVGIKAVTMSQEHGLIGEEALALCSLGGVYLSVKEYQRARECFTDALNIVTQAHLPYEESRVWLNIGRLYADENLAEMAIEPLERSLTIAQQIQARGLQIAIYQSLSTVYRQTNQYQNALVYYERFHELNQQVFANDSETRLKNLEVVYQVNSARREAELEQAKNQALQQEVSERSRIQHDLEKANNQLQHEIAVREQLIGDLNSFTNMVAHDLKTPLQAIAILTHLLQLQLEEMPNNSDALDLVSQLQQTYQKSNTIIQELLTLASLRSKNIKLMPLDMEKIIHEVLLRINFMIVEYQAEITILQEWPVVKGHAPWMEEVWVNYLSNAMKYGGFPPVIQIGATRSDDGQVKFWVQDNGDGVKPEDQGRLFNDFSQLESRRKVDGHGLGLSIVRRIIEKMGGKIGVESRGRSGEGSRFWFTLPVVDPDGSDQA